MADGDRLKEKMVKGSTAAKNFTYTGNSMDAAMEIFELTKRFPAEERYSMVDQIRRSSRSACANLSEGWRKRHYKAAFISKLSDSETEAGEAQVWLESAFRCKCLDEKEPKTLDTDIDQIIGQIVRMIDEADK